MILRAEKLTKTFRQGAKTIEVLRGVDLCVEPGATIAILGQSGSGKSTLLSLLSGLDHPSSGEVILSNNTLASMNEAKLAKYRSKHLGIIFQQFHLMSNLTALENVALPLEITGISDATDRARKALEQVALADRMDHLPSELSGGECQRVAVARAFVVEPDLLLADEPSGNLDNLTGEKVMNLIFELSRAKKTALILVTHNLDLARRCDQIYELKNGSLHKMEKN